MAHICTSMHSNPKAVEEHQLARLLASPLVMCVIPIFRSELFLREPGFLRSTQSKTKYKELFREVKATNVLLNTWLTQCPLFLHLRASNIHLLCLEVWEMVLDCIPISSCEITDIMLAIRGWHHGTPDKTTEAPSMTQGEDTFRPSHPLVVAGWILDTPPPPFFFNALSYWDNISDVQRNWEVAPDIHRICKWRRPSNPIISVESQLYVDRWETSNQGA